METSVNDVEELHESDRFLVDPPTRIRKYTEILINLLINLKHRPAIVYLGASTRGYTAWNTDIPRDTDAVFAQVEVAKHYRIPYVSAVDGLGPFYTKELQEWFLNKFRSDNYCHVSILGHQILAHLFINLLFQHYWSLIHPFLPALHMQTPYGKIAPLHASRSEINMYLYSKPLHVSAIRSSIRDYIAKITPGWRVYEDVKGKPGLIAHTPGEMIRFVLNTVVVLKHMHVGVLHISFLKSYEHMGIVSVNLFSVDETDVSRNPYNVSELLAATIVDCLWEKQVSEVVVIELVFNISSYRKRLLIELTIAATLRVDNKIKLLGFLVY